MRDFRRNVERRPLTPGNLFHFDSALYCFPSSRFLAGMLLPALRKARDLGKDDQLYH